MQILGVHSYLNSSCHLVSPLLRALGLVPLKLGPHALSELVVGQNPPRCRRHAFRRGQGKIVRLIGDGSRRELLGVVGRTAVSWDAVYWVESGADLRNVALISRVRAWVRDGPFVIAIKGHLREANVGHEVAIDAAESTVRNNLCIIVCSALRRDWISPGRR